MPSGPIKKVAIRREKIAMMLSMSVTSPSVISEELGIAYQTVKDDIAVIRESSKDRMFGLARDGYAHDCFMAVDACMRYEADMEKELTELIQVKKDNDKLLEDMQETLEDLLTDAKKNAKEISALYNQIGFTRAANTTNLNHKLAVRKQLVETKIARLNIEGEGPTLLAVRGVIKGELLSDAEKNQSEKQRGKT